jgi:anti-anti-sigma factor
MNIKIEHKDNLKIIRLSGKMLGSDSETFIEKLSGNIDEKQYNFLFNFKDVEAIDSLCVGCLITIIKRIKRKNSDSSFKLVKPDNSRVQKIFAMVHLRDLIEFVNTESEAF